MQKVIIIGGGFGGMAAALKLKGRFEVLLLDCRSRASFLPLLPDCIGRGIRPQALTFDIGSFAGRAHFSFLEEKVLSVDLASRSVKTSSRTLSYDYLVIASGTETNFYDNDAIKRHGYALDNAEDAVKMKSALESKPLDSVIISGGGYTGIEVATNVWAFLKKRNQRKKIMIVERAPAILGSLPEWMKDYVAGNLKRMDIEVSGNTTIADVGQDKVILSSGAIYDKAMLIWAAGVKTPEFIQGLRVAKNPQGRITVDKYLRLDERTFVAGDAANVAYRDSFLRMAVQFAITEGSHAALNIIRSARGVPLKEFKAVDLGYIIPMANNRSCGLIMGVAMKGHIPTLFHYIMCIYRSFGWRNRRMIAQDLLRGK